MSLSSILLAIVSSDALSLHCCARAKSWLTTNRVPLLFLPRCSRKAELDQPIFDTKGNVERRIQRYLT